MATARLNPPQQHDQQRGIRFSRLLWFVESDTASPSSRDLAETQGISVSFVSKTYPPKADRAAAFAAANPDYVIVP